MAGRAEARLAAGQHRPQRTNCDRIVGAGGQYAAIFGSKRRYARRVPKDWGRWDPKPTRIWGPKSARKWPGVGPAPTRRRRQPQPTPEPDPTPAPPEEPVNRLPSTLPKILRDAGLKVVEHDGWQTRGRPASTGAFTPVGVLCHHTATARSSSDAAVVSLLIRGRSDLPGPLCHLGLSRDGTVHVIAAGRANHAGKAKSSGTVAGGDGNRLYIGIEAFNDGVGEKWPAVQYDAYVKLAATLCQQVTHNSVQTVRGHKETSVTGKIDPTSAWTPSASGSRRARTPPQEEAPEAEAAAAP